VFYSITQNVIGTYGLGVLIASRYGRAPGASWWVQLRDIATVPSLWAFALGMTTHSLSFPVVVDESLRKILWVVIPVALLLMGMRLSQLNGWKSIRLALVPSLIKVVIVPGLLGLILLFAPIEPESRLAVVLMAGMPTAFAGLILAEEYELDRDLISSSIVLTTLLLSVTLPLWLLLWGGA
jgi:malate permease and related proteins